MKIFRIPFTGDQLEYIMSLVEADRQQTTEIALATGDQQLLVEVNYVKNFQIDVLRMAEHQGFNSDRLKEFGV